MSEETGAEAATLSPHTARGRFRSGLVTPTTGWASGFTQTNLVALPQEWAYDMLLFGQRNPNSLPLLDVTEPGQRASTLADADLATDLPLYRIWEKGELVDEPTDVAAAWREDLVTFLIGCSFSFETALLDAGVPVRNIDQRSNVPLYKTNVACRSAGRLSGPLVVSMRPVPGSQVATAVQVTARMPRLHGAPVHVGHPSALGIGNLDAPDFGDRVEMRSEDIPVFWACGVTSQAALLASRPPFAITHAPGHMLITDVPHAAYRLP